MKKIKFISFAIALVFALSGVSINASEIQFSYTYGDQDYSQIGTKKAETYDVAIRIVDPSLVGTKITSFNVPIVNPTEESSISGVSVWVTKELTLDKKVNVPDVMSMEAEIIDGEINVSFPETIEIPVGGLYVGYTFTVDQKSEDLDYPVFAAGKPHEDGFYLHTSRTYLKWKAQSDNFGCSSAITVGIDGNFYANALGVTTIQKPYASSGMEMMLKATITNHGYEPLTSFEYEITDGVTSNTETYAFDEARVFNFGQAFEAQFPWVAPVETGDYNLSVVISKVNGQDNRDVANKFETVLDVFNMLPIHKPLMEEYTGLWCGWCPRGFVGLEVMNSRHPEKFVGISYHNGDAMERIKNSSYPNLVSGFPAAFMDRVYSIDAYSGDADEGFGIDPFWQSLQETFTPAAINGSASENEDGSITVKSDISFVRQTSGSYKVAYVIIANGLTDDSWGQSNYYTRYKDQVEQYIPEMEKFILGESTVYGLVFDDVFAAGSNIRGEEDSIIENVEADKVYTHEFSFGAQDGISLSGYDLFKNASTLNAIIILLDNTGAVVNTNKVLVTGHNSGIEVVSPDAISVKTEYYDINGRSVKDPSKGIFIKVETREDGTRKVTKMVK